MTGFSGGVVAIPNAVMYNSGAFVAPSTGTFCGFDLTGLAYDDSANEKAAITLWVPAAWNTCTLKAICLSANAGNAVLLANSVTGAAATTIAMPGSYGSTVATLATDIPLAASALSNNFKSAGTAALERMTDNGADVLVGDLYVLGLELVRTS